MVSWNCFTRSKDFTRANSSAWSNGLVTKSSAPASKAWSLSFSPLAVIMTTGRNAVVGSSRSLRHTSNPSMGSITTSSRMRSGCCCRTIARASSPEEAEVTVYPFGVNTASSNRTFWGVSSTTRTVAGSVTVITPPVDQQSNHLTQRVDADRLLQVPVEPRVERPLFVVCHGERGDGHDGNGHGPLVVLEALHGVEPVHLARQLDVQENHLGQVLVRQCDARFRGCSFDHGVPLVRQDVTHQLHVGGVVLDHEYPPVVHRQASPRGSTWWVARC